MKLYVLNDYIFRFNIPMDNSVTVNVRDGLVDVAENG